MRVCARVSANTQQQAEKNLKHQNMSEWIITTPRHKGMGQGERKAGGKWWDGWSGRNFPVTPFKGLSVWMNACTWEHTVHTHRLKLFYQALLTHAHTHIKTYMVTHTHTAAILISLSEFYPIPSPPQPPLSFPPNGPRFKTCCCRGRLQSPVICLGKQ